MTDLSSGPTAQPAVRTGRFVQLVPLVVPAHLEFLYNLAVDENTGFHWRLAGTVPSVEVFRDSLWKGVFCQFVVAQRRSHQPVGHVVGYGVDHANGFAYVAGAVTPAVQATGLGVEAFDLFGAYLFRVFNLRKLYFEIPEYNLAMVANNLGGLLRQEGRLVDHTYYDGRYWDRVILAVHRGDYVALRGPARGRRRRQTSAGEEAAP